MKIRAYGSKSFSIINFRSVSTNINVYCVYHLRLSMFRCGRRIITHKHWANIAKVVGLIPAVVGHFFFNFPGMDISSE